MAYSVEERTQEIGIRLALGAAPGVVRRMVVLQGLRLAAVGIVVGLTGAYLLSRFISAFLFGVEARDPLVFVGVPAVLPFIALAAVSVPAMRASRVDPLEALRVGPVRSTRGKARQRETCRGQVSHRGRAARARDRLHRRTVIQRVGSDRRSIELEVGKHRSRS